MIPRLLKCGGSRARDLRIRWQACEANLIAHESRRQAHDGPGNRRLARLRPRDRPLAHFVHDLHGDLMNRQYGLRRLQRTHVGRDDDAGQREIGEFHRGRLGLLHAERRQFRILDPRVNAGRVEVQVEIALPVAEQKHDASPCRGSRREPHP